MSPFNNDSNDKRTEIKERTKAALFPKARFSNLLWLLCFIFFQKAERLSSSFVDFLCEDMIRNYNFFKNRKCS